MDCGPPPRLPLTQLTAVSSTLYGSTVRLQCEEGHQAYGDMSLRCLTNRRWSRLRGRCVRESSSIIQSLFFKKKICKSVLKSNVKLLRFRIPFDCKIMDKKPIKLILVIHLWLGLTVQSRLLVTFI